MIDETQNDTQDEEIRNKRQQVERMLALGELEDKIVTVEITETPPSMFDLLQGSGMEQMGMNMQDAFGQFMPTKKKKRKASCSGS